MDDERILTAIAAVAGAVSALDSKVAALDGKVNGLDGKFTALDNTVTRLRVDVMARLDRHENALTGIRQDIAVNMHRADWAHKHSDNTRSELRELGGLVAAMERQQRYQGERITALENGKAHPPA